MVKSEVSVTLMLSVSISTLLNGNGYPGGMVCSQSNDGQLITIDRSIVVPYLIDPNQSRHLHLHHPTRHPTHIDVQRLAQEVPAAAAAAAAERPRAKRVLGLVLLHQVLLGPQHAPAGRCRQPASRYHRGPPSSCACSRRSSRQ